MIQKIYGLLTPLLIMASVPRSDVNGAFSFIIDLTGDMPVGFNSFFLPGVLYRLSFAKVDDVASDIKPTFPFMVANACIALGFVLMVVCPCVDAVAFWQACSGEDGCSNY